MPYPPSFVPNSRPTLTSDSNPSPSPPSQSKTSRTHYSSRKSMGPSGYVADTGSVYDSSPVVVSPDVRGLPQLGYCGQKYDTVANSYHVSHDRGEDSDYFNESTPGRAWKKSDHAHPRMRVLGFDTSAQYTSRSGSSDPSLYSHLGHNSSAAASMTCKGVGPEKADFLRRQNLELSSDKSRISHASTSPMSVPHSDGSKRTFPRDANAYYKKHDQGLNDF